MFHLYTATNLGPFRERIARLVGSKAKLPEVVVLARELFAFYLGHTREFRPAIHALLDLGWSIDDLAIAVLDSESTMTVAHQLQVSLGHLLLGNTDWDLQDFRWLEQFCDSARSDEARDGRKPYTSMKLQVVCHTMNGIGRTSQFVAKLELPNPGETLAAMGFGVGNLEAETRAFMERLLELRRYGIKSSFMQRGPRLSSAAAWAMWGFHDFTRNLNLLPGGSQVAQVALIPEASQITDLRPLYSTEGDLELIDLPFENDLWWTLDDRGELDMGLGMGALPVRQLFEAAGKLSHYEVLRLWLLYHLWDLVVPLTKAAALAVQAPPFLAGTPQPLQQDVPVTAERSPIGTLLLPRIRLIEDAAAVRRELQREFEGDEQRTAARARRKVGKHEVGWFIRKLPQGHHATQMARELARPIYGELREGETFVKKHDRGEGERTITAHRARRRRGGGNS